MKCSPSSNKLSRRRDVNISFFSLPQMLISGEVSSSSSPRLHKPERKATTFLYCWAEKKRIISSAVASVWRCSEEINTAPSGESRQTKTDLSYLLQQRHTWDVDLRSPEIIKTSASDGTLKKQTPESQNIHTFIRFDSSRITLDCAWVVRSVFANLIRHTPFENKDWSAAVARQKDITAEI